MKKVFTASFLLVLLASCEFNVIEPRYDYRDSITGHYGVEEYSETYNDVAYYSLSITKDYHAHYTIYINNFYASGLRVYARLEGSKITIPYQVVDDYEIEGVGTLYGHDLSINYRIKDLYHNTRTDFCELWGSLEY